MFKLYLQMIIWDDFYINPISTNQTKSLEPPNGLKKCSRARQGGRGERHCLLITGYRGVDGTFVNGHRRLYRTHPGQMG